MMVLLTRDSEIESHSPSWENEIQRIIKEYQGLPKNYMCPSHLVTVFYLIGFLAKNRNYKIN